MTAKQATAVDLFAGAGGLSLGLANSGIEVKWALESDLWAADTYAENHPDTKIDCLDITALSGKQMESRLGRAERVDIVAGGPPCQGFSHSNVGRRDPKDPRNSLFLDFLRAVDTFRPRLCLMENVRGLLTTQDAAGNRAIDTILAAFGDVGYDAEFRVLNAVHYGVPQHRERLFIIARRSDVLARFRWPEATHGLLPSGRQVEALFEHSHKAAVTLWDAISDLPRIESSELFEDYACGAQNDFQAEMRRGSTVLRNHEPMRHTSRIRARFAEIGYGQSELHASAENAVRRRGHGDELGRAYGQNSRRQHPDLPCNTVVASSHTNFIHPSLHRNFTVRELARVQSFPDWFTFKGKRAVLSRKLSARKGFLDDLHLDQRAQVGNAVPPLLALRLGSNLIECLELDRAGMANGV